MATALSTYLQNSRAVEVVSKTILSLVLLAIAATAGCKTSSDEPQRVTEITEPRDAVSEELMLALGQAKNFHGKADVYVKNGDVAKAIAEVERVLSIPFPKDAPEGEDVTLDARARLAKLLLGKGDIAAARSVVTTGIESATRDSFFLANLHTVHGEVLEAQAVLLADTDSQAAKGVRLEAIAAFDRSIAINEKLQKQLLEESGQ